MRRELYFVPNYISRPELQKQRSMRSHASPLGDAEIFEF